MNFMMFVVCLCLGIIYFVLNIYYVVKFVRKAPLGNEGTVMNKNNKIMYYVFNLSVGIFTILSSIGLTFMLKDGEALNGGEYASNIIGSYLFGTSVSFLITSFIIFYYRPDLEKRQRKLIRIILFASIPVIFIGLWLLTNAFADHITYPLFNAISFTKGLVRPDDKSDIGFNIKFYGILIVIGAAISYFISDHAFYKKYGKHGIIDTLLLVAFPAGIIGARIWYCTILEPGTNLFAIRDGGLAIQGGALGGIVVGVAFMLIFRKYVNIRWAMDVIIPTILIAQMIGRWGNFFNNEVHGMATEMSNWWFLPKIIANNMQYSSTTSSLVGTSQMYVPLFLIEGVTNTIGYFLIRYGVGHGLKRWKSGGDLAMCYVLWYGFTRLFLEPLRSSSYEYQNSITMAIFMIVAGFVGIILFHLYDYFSLGYKKSITHFIKKEFKKEERNSVKEKYLSLIDKNKKTSCEENVFIFYSLLLSDPIYKEDAKKILQKYINDYYFARKTFYLNRIDVRFFYRYETNKLLKENALNHLVESIDNTNKIDIVNPYKEMCKEAGYQDLSSLFVIGFLNSYQNVKHGKVSLLSALDSDTLTLEIACK